MNLVARSEGTTLFDVDDVDVSPGSDAHELAASLVSVGLLLPLVVSPEGVLLDGHKRAAALRILGESHAPAIRTDDENKTVIHSLALRLYGRSRNIPIDPGSSRSTLERAEKVLTIAEDATLTIALRLHAAEGISNIDKGKAANTVFEEVRDCLNTHDATSRYPELAGIDSRSAARMAAYLDSVADEDRIVELAAFRAARSNGTDSALAMNVYTRVQSLAQTVDPKQASEVSNAITSAIESGELPPNLNERCLEVAGLLEDFATAIRVAVHNRTETMATL